MTVEVPLVHILSRSIEVGTTRENSLPLLLLALLPDIDLLLEYLVIEWNNSELGELGAVVECIAESIEQRV